MTARTVIDAAVPGCHACHQNVSRIRMAEGGLARAARMRSAATTPAAEKRRDVFVHAAKTHLARECQWVADHLRDEHSLDVAA